MKDLNKKPSETEKVKPESPVVGQKPDSPKGESVTKTTPTSKPTAPNSSTQSAAKAPSKTSTPIVKQPATTSPIKKPITPTEKKPASSVETKPTPKVEQKTAVTPTAKPEPKTAEKPTATPTAKPEPKATEKPAAAPSRPQKNPADVDLSQVNALVVEDDAGGMAIIGVMMRFLNIKAYINTTGEGVVQMARAMHPRPNIVFCDINLPRTTGYDVLKELRSDPELKDVLVIAVTAQDADTEIPKAREAGFDGYIGKPLNRMRFPKQLRRIFAGEEVWETY